MSAVEMSGDENEDCYDAVVVGSGYGGSVAACRMSMVGIKVCLIEKGCKWEAQDFPTNSFKMASASRIENKNWGFSFGPKDALFQVHIQDDSVASVACGLGGGSLVNAGVMIRTPVRARRNSKWPKEWEKDWEVCEASASVMLKSQSVPVEFPHSKVMRGIAEEEIEESSEDSIKLSINFETKEESPTAMGSQQMGNCLACGNCLSGCPYNAKNSTDKNYLALAIQAGCTVKTECQVQYVVENSNENGERGGRRWRVYFNDLDYITSDFVVLSAGVFGTTEILFKSEKRGLRLSERLGFGLSCNGNNVAYLAGSPAPLNAYGLDGKHFSKIPFQDRPGPSISSSYTSSLGFTIQSAVLPTAYPYMLFKGILTYGWPIGCWFLHGIIDKLKHMVGLKASQAMVLNAMGYDESDGRITLEKDTNKICFSPPRDPLLPRKIQALQKLTKRLGGILFMSRYRSTSVHLLGGCNAASDASNGVCHPNGQVFDPKSPSKVHMGLYVCDASLIPCSIGINPCLTIATTAEHVSRHLVQDVLKHKGSSWPVQLPLVDKSVDSKRKSMIDRKLDTSANATVIVKETMRGHIGGMPCTAYLTMKMNPKDKKGLDGGKLALGEPHPLLRGNVGGYVVFQAVEKDELHIIEGKVDLCRVDGRTPYTQYMHYYLLLASASGSRFILEGKKIMNPYLLASNAWRESTTLHVTFKTVHQNGISEKLVDLKGELSLSIFELLRSLLSLRGNRKGRFICILLQSLLRTYILQIPRGSFKDFSPYLSEIPYPPNTLHELETGDGVMISCREWKCTQNPWRSEEERHSNPVLLVNGHSAESFWLPTEPNDLVRTLINEGHDIWLLQTRLHPLHPSNNFTIEDIGKFDIPAVIAKIGDLHGSSVKVHVVAHCVGGLALHISLMGGHVSATQIASLSCTNSSMFFKLTVSSMIKMRLPLILISMMILGKNKILPMWDSSKVSSRHQLLKSIARLIPRYERCGCDECEVFSGIFGTPFWHNNVSPTMHYWLNKQNLSRLPMSAFPHIQKICTSGFIVDPDGKNKYLVHPERMALSTLYISGGRSLLVTPQTSFLANQYMKLHQPDYRHTRVVVDGFGHSDLLIGEESDKKVFPHIISHIRLAEQGSNGAKAVKESKYSKESLAWGGDLYEENRKFGSCGSTLALFLLFLLFVLILILLLL